MKKVYISHPFSGNTLKNKYIVHTICKELAFYNKVIPISPLHLFFFYDKDINREQIMQVCLHLIDTCDELWAYGKSRGCLEEIEYAKEEGIKVVYK